MRPIYAVLAGVAVVAATGIGAFASEPKSTVHEVTIDLPGGGIEHIRYTGNVLPHVTVRTIPQSELQAEFDSDPAFSDPFFVSFGDMSDQMSRMANEMYRMQAAMHQRMQVMMQQAQQMQRLGAAGPNALIEADLANQAPGSVSYSYMSTSTGNGSCTQMVQVTTSKNGKPNVVSKTSGNCADTSLSSPAPVLDRTPPAPNVLSISAHRSDGTATPAVYTR
ncbi:MAG: hypothetical protein GC190_11575 [Alphaproteobacteria bacterium]|nr:hypothetical protein [Alphaproteobacteria bacterium]